MTDLRAQTDFRIQENYRRKRLYPPLTDGFLRWWNEQRRYWNEPIQVVNHAPHGNLVIAELGVTIKVENLLSLKYGGHTRRIVYPYFSEEPALSGGSSRIALWAANEALPDCSLAELHVLDVLRGESFSADGSPLDGSEEKRLIQMSREVISLWKKLLEEYK